MAEIEVLKVLARTVKAIRRGENLELVDPAISWEKKITKRIEELEKPEGGQEPDGNQQATGEKCHPGMGSLFGMHRYWPSWKND